MSTLKVVNIQHPSAASATLILDSSGNLALPAGSASTPALQGPSDTNTGLFFPAADTIAFAEGGTEALRINSSGRVGIGTSSPVVELQVNNSSDVSIALSNSSSVTSGNRANIGCFNSSVSTVGLIRFGAVTDNVGTEIQFHTRPAAGSLTQSMTLDSSGRLGIGTTSPSSALHVVGSAFSTTAITTGASPASLSGQILNESDTSKSITIAADPGNTGASSFLGFAVDGSERARLTSSGQWLVGTSSARTAAIGGSNQVVFEAAANYFNTIFASNNNTPDSSFLCFIKSRGTTSGSHTIVANGDDLGVIDFEGADGSVARSAARITAQVDGTPGSGDMPGRLVFSTTADGASSPTERIRINNKGYFKATATGNYYGVSVDYHELRTANSDWATVFSNSHASNPYGILVAYTATPNGTDNYFFYAVDGTTLRAQIRSNGGLANYSANNANLSDRNAKKDITPAAGTWDCIKEWEIVNYRYKDQPDDADLNLGVIAQQVAESCPEVITVFQEATEDEPEKLGVKEQQMYWMAIKALQEAQVRIEQLEATNADLLARVSALETA